MTKSLLNELMDIDLDPKALDRLSEREQRITLEALQEMQRRRNRESFRYWEPTEEQQAILDDLYRYPDVDGIIVFGGNGSGKDHFLKNLTTQIIDGQTGPFKDRFPAGRPITIRNTILDFDAGYENLVNNEGSGYRSIIPRKYLKGGSWKSAQTRKSNGTARVDLADHRAGGVIEIMSDKQDASVHGGPARDLYGCNEIPRHEQVFKEDLRRLGRNRESNSLAILTGTQVRGKHTWLKSFIQDIESGKMPRWRIYYLNALNNRHIDQARLKRDMQYMSPQEILMRVMGQDVPLGDLMFPNFCIDRNVIPHFNVPRNWPKVVACDAHRRKDNYLVYAAFEILHDRIFIHIWKEIACRGSIEDTNKLAVQACAGYHIDEWWLERSVSTGTKEPTASDWELWTDKRVSKYANERWQKWDGNAELRWSLMDRFTSPIPDELETRYISEVSKCMYRAQFLVHDNCEDTIDQIMNASWKPNADESMTYSERAVKLDDDYKDCGMVICQSAQNLQTELNDRLNTDDQISETVQRQYPVQVGRY